jgi:Large polyvalent protein associated domain 30/Large polyvalent protein associated domain 29
VNHLIVGSWIHCILYGGKDGVIYAIHGEQRPETCSNIFRGVGVTGGNATFDIVWENGSESRMIPEALVRGSVQWRILEEVPVSAEVIQTMREYAASELARKDAEKKAEDSKFLADIAVLRKDKRYAHLEQTGPDVYGNCGRLVAANLRKEFKKLWPVVKFSVRKEHHGCVNIHWTDGPLAEEVKAVVDKYKGGHFNGMEDIYEHSRSPWTSVFGSCDYIFPTRSHSPEALKEAVREVCFEYGWDLVKVETSSDGSAYLTKEREEQRRKIYDYIEKRHEYQPREPGPGDREYEELRARVAALELAQIGGAA